MAVREVLRVPHPDLKRTCDSLDPASDRERIKALVRDLLDTMRAFPGATGIAAPQVGELVRLAVVDVSEHRKTTACHGTLVLVNPVLTASQGAEVGREGCLSIPDLTANVRRATRIGVEALDEHGAAVAIDTEGFEARCILHELDHLDGLLFLDRVDSIATDVFERRTRRPQPGDEAPGPS